MASAQDLGWYSNFKNFDGKRGEYDKYFENGQLKQGYSMSGSAGGSQLAYSNKVEGKLVGNNNTGRRREPTKTFSIYKLPTPPPAPAPAPPPPARQPQKTEFIPNTPKEEASDSFKKQEKRSEDYNDQLPEYGTRIVGERNKYYYADNEFLNNNPSADSIADAYLQGTIARVTQNNFNQTDNSVRTSIGDDNRFVNSRVGNNDAVTNTKQGAWGLNLAAGRDARERAARWLKVSKR